MLASTARLKRLATINLKEASNKANELSTPVCGKRRKLQEAETFRKKLFQEKSLGEGHDLLPTTEL
jgi:hypothetical protein